MIRYNNMLHAVFIPCKMLKPGTGVVSLRTHHVAAIRLAGRRARRSRRRREAPPRGRTTCPTGRRGEPQAGDRARTLAVGGSFRGRGSLGRAIGQAESALGLPRHSQALLRRWPAPGPQPAPIPVFLRRRCVSFLAFFFSLLPALPSGSRAH